MPFVHYIAIRYNVPHMFTGRTDREGRRTADEEWLRHRQQLFTTYTLPSLAQQSSGNFRIIVFYDQASPAWLKEENESLQQRYGNFVPEYVNSLGDAIALLDRSIANLAVAEGLTHAIVTRLDNDDALHKNAVRRLQARFHGQDFEVFNFDGIVSFRRAPGEVLNYSRYRGGPFVSLIQRIGAHFHTPIFDKMHGDWLREGRVTQLGPFPYAMQVLHERNLANAPGGAPIFGLNLRSYGFEYSMVESFGQRFATHLRYKRAKRAAKKAARANKAA